MHKEVRETDNKSEVLKNEQEEKAQKHIAPVCAVSRAYPQSESTHTSEVSPLPEEGESGYLY